MRFVPLFIPLVVLATGCATVDYVGEVFPRTSQVDLFFSESDVSRPYRVVGQVLATGDQYSSAAKVHRKLMERARESGADGVVILEVARVPGQGVHYEETKTVSADDDGKSVQTTGSVMPAAESKKIRALFIKYRE